jgi:AcrR family transcriptional regulator
MNEEVPVGTPVRAPQQGRSKASLERMLAAAESLMVDKGSDDFTLVEVSRVGRVSIGSIYNRFAGKGELVHSVQARVLERMNVQQTAMLEAVSAMSATLPDFMLRFVDGFAESLRDNAALLRPLMVVALADPAISGQGKQSADSYTRAVAEAMLAYRADIRRPDPERAVLSAYRVIYATLARYLGLGSSAEASGEGDWAELKRDLATMCAAFLGSP